MKNLFSIAIILFSFNALYSQETLLFKPLTANVFEPRIGSMYQFGGDKLRLDIGYSLDMVEFEIDSNAIRVGADFFTYTRLRSAGRFKFPVETSDYFFGVNASGKLFREDIRFRLRIAHISSHMVDGYTENGEFIEEPFTYSREFVDFCAARYFGDLRWYVGFNFIFSTIPADDIGQFNYYVGADYELELSDGISFVAGYDFKLIGFDPGAIYRGTNCLQAGILFSTFASAGVMLNAHYYGGPSMHGMFHKQTDDYFGIGFQLIFY